MCATQLKQIHGPLWRQKFRLLLVFGEPAQLDALAPGLSTNPWLEGEGIVLIQGGSAQKAAVNPSLTHWKSLCHRRAFDGVVWALTADQRNDTKAMGQGVRQLRELAQTLRWQLPLHIWHVCDGEWGQDGRATQPVGGVLPSQPSAKALSEVLRGVIEPLRRGGWAQVQENLHHDFLLRLSRDLQAGEIARWAKALSPLFGRFVPGVTLRGLWFSPPLKAVLPVRDDVRSSFWLMDPAWYGILKDRPGRARRIGWPKTRIAYACALSLAALWGAGLLLSFVSNRAQLLEVERNLAAVRPQGDPDQQVLALHELMRELGRLDWRAHHGEAWSRRFGLSQNGVLLERLWPRYVEANHRLMRDPASALLEQQLQALIALPPNSPERSAQAHTAYLQLKAYLMMARPEKVDAAFLGKVLKAAEPQRAGVSPGLWQGLSPALWQFYADQLKSHPEWRIEVDPTLLARARQVLIGQLGQRNAEATLYRQVLDSAADEYAALDLQDLTGETDARSLFSSTASVPGVFTRQAWDGQVRDAIERIAEARREQIDWVLSDREGDIAPDLTPNTLRERLTARYFQDYGSAWLAFLNSLRWQRTGSLGDVIDQLSLMSDVRQSPLIALMNNLAWQGQAGQPTQALSTSLLKSAQKLVGRDKTQAIDQALPDHHGPLDATFGPLLSLMGKEAGAGDDSLSLHAFLTRVTRARLKLQQVGNASDPQGLTQALAQTVFQGKGIDLTETQAYGHLLAASLGAEWAGIGQTLFVQPLDQAWQQVLQPSAASLNRQWQQSIVDHWNDAFVGRYPFAATGSDASLPLLGQLIRADSGRIEQFLQRQLDGVLRKEGNRWVADPQHSQGLRINPQFLAAINQLSQLADVLYTDGGMGLSFELQGKAVRDVVQTTFTLNGERHHYFNQKESWQRFAWPGSSAHPGASLTWTSVRTGERLYGDYQGIWGLIRLLEEARVTPLDDSESRFRVVLTAPDGLGLTWYLRTELGAGPMSLLKLRGFTLPKQIFLTARQPAHNGGES
ncbi:ImcF-related family protein [Pseudomonas sp. NPDC088444]|uniref:ImcF-related family protein n=1 Tax=Pseudomonas sp. NPDC088444 TaxID=3364456 RepID=UPI0038503E97